MAMKFILAYEAKEEIKEKKIYLPRKLGWLYCNKRPYKYKNKFGVKIIYLLGSKKRERIVALPRDAKDVVIEL